jgi:hypothetical protein
MFFLKCTFFLNACFFLSCGRGLKDLKFRATLFLVCKQKMTSPTKIILLSCHWRTPRVNFTKVLHAKIPKAQKDTDDLTIHLFALLESSHVKASRKHVGEIDPMKENTEARIHAQKLARNFLEFSKTFFNVKNDAFQVWHWKNLQSFIVCSIP